MFNEAEDIKDISYLLNENEDVDEDNDVDEYKITYKKSPFKSIIQDIKDKFSKSGDELIKKGIYYVEKMKSFESAEIKNIKEKLIIFKTEK